VTPLETPSSPAVTRPAGVGFGHHLQHRKKNKTSSQKKKQKPPIDSIVAATQAGVRISPPPLDRGG
jgi:hypothetical protein